MRLKVRKLGSKSKMYTMSGRPSASKSGRGIDDVNSPSEQRNPVDRTSEDETEYPTDKTSRTSLSFRRAPGSATQHVDFIALPLDGQYPFKFRASGSTEITNNLVESVVNRLGILTSTNDIDDISDVDINFEAVPDDGSVPDNKSAPDSEDDPSVRSIDPPKEREYDLPASSDDNDRRQPRREEEMMKLPVSRDVFQLPPETVDSNRRAVIVSSSTYEDHPDIENTYRKRLKRRRNLSLAVLADDGGTLLDKLWSRFGYGLQNMRRQQMNEDDPQKYISTQGASEHANLRVAGFAVDEEPSVNWKRVIARVSQETKEKAVGNNAERQTRFESAFNKKFRQWMPLSWAKIVRNDYKEPEIRNVAMDCDELQVDNPKKMSSQGRNPLKTSNGLLTSEVSNYYHRSNSYAKYVFVCLFVFVCVFASGLLAYILFI